MCICARLYHNIPFLLKMDTEGSDNMLEQLVSLLSEGQDRYEEGLLNIEERMWPEKQIQFREIIPISAKHNQKTVEYVKERLRMHLDEIEDEQKNYSEIVERFRDEIDKLNVDLCPKVA